MTLPNALRSEVTRIPPEFVHGQSLTYYRYAGPRRFSLGSSAGRFTSSILERGGRGGSAEDLVG